MAGEAFLSVVQQAAARVVDSMDVTAMVSGTVVSIAPLSVRIEERLNISAANLSMSPLCYPNIQTIAGEQVTIWPGIAAGDKVRLIRQTGGKQYYILGKEGGI